MNRSSLLRPALAQAAMEVRLTLRRGESVLVTVIIPVALMAFFASARVLPAAGRSISFLLPGTVTLAVISTGLVSLGIATAYERYYGVLKRLGSTPFPRAGLVLSKVLAVAAVEALQILLLVGVAALFFGWRPHGSLLLALAVLILGTCAFTGIGLAMAGALRAEATLAGANGLFLVFLLVGGLYVPIDHLPPWLVPIAHVLPADPLATMLRAALSSHLHMPWISAAILAAWAIAAPLLAIATFQWE